MSCGSGSSVCPTGCSVSDNINNTAVIAHTGTETCDNSNGKHRIQYETKASGSANVLSASDGVNCWCQPKA